MTLLIGQLRIWARLFCREALRAVLRHKMRSALTTLGVIIGIAAVVLVVAIGQSASSRVEAQLQALGDNLVWVEAGSRNVAGTRTGSHGTTSLTVDDAEAIAREVHLVRSASPQMDGSAQVRFGNRNWSTRFRGVAPSYLPIKRWEIAEGASFTDEDVEEARNVCVIGAAVREQLFPGAPAVGETMQVGGQLFTVVGVMVAKGQTGMGFNQDDVFFLPFTTAQTKLLGRDHHWLDDIVCSARSSADVALARLQIIDLMRQRHRIALGDEDDFNIRRPEEVINAQLESTRTFELLLVCVACIALLVGGIGIMNVMLASVAERTREIGVRLAVGAKDWMVQLQFLGEATALSFFGGLVGVAVSVAGCFVAERLLEWQVKVPPQAVALGLGFSIVVGVFFGFYPARRAARLDPIDALRHE